LGQALISLFSLFCFYKSIKKLKNIPGNVFLQKIFAKFDYFGYFLFAAEKRSKKIKINSENLICARKFVKKWTKNKYIFYESLFQNIFPKKVFIF